MRRIPLHHHHHQQQLNNNPPRVNLRNTTTMSNNNTNRPSVRPMPLSSSSTTSTPPSSEENWQSKMEQTSLKYKKLHPESTKARGRPIPLILLDRQVRGSRAIGGIRRIFKRKTEEKEEEPKKRSTLNAYPCSITHEIQNYSEYHSVTQFHSSYLNHLGGGNNGNSTPAPPPRNTRRPPSQNSSSAVSTISIAFGPTGKTLASTHGDHTVKITCSDTGRLIRNLEGHPRTPWTVKYHPTKENIVASGCLGFQVRVWDWNWRSERIKAEARERRRRMREKSGGRGRRRRGMVGVLEEHERRSGSPRGVGQYDTDSSSPTSDSYHSSDSDSDSDSEDEEESLFVNYSMGMGVCLNMIRLQYAIISLAFHPSGKMLAVASGSTLHLWDYDDYAGKVRRKREAKALKKAGGEKKTKGNTGGGGGRFSFSVGNEYTSRSLSSRGTGNTARFSSSSSSNTSSTSRHSTSTSQNARNTSGSRGGARTEMRHENALRCVHFPPSGKTIIVGGVNPPTPHNNDRGSGMSGGGMSFSLRLWDFDLEAALYPAGMEEDGEGSSGGSGGGGGVNMRLAGSSVGKVVRREAMSNARTFVPRALLYNDGGFDVSPDGKTLCACAEYWLPEGVDNAMDILDRPPPDDDYDDDDEDIEDGGNVDGRNEGVADGSSSSIERSEVNDAGRILTRLSSSGGDGSSKSSSYRYSSPPRQHSLSSNSGHNTTTPAPSGELSLVAPPPPPGPPSGMMPRHLSSHPVTPPNTNRARMPLSPPSPPGRRWPGGLHQRGTAGGGGGGGPPIAPREGGAAVPQRTSRHTSTATSSSSTSHRYTSTHTSRHHHHHHTTNNPTITSASPPPPPPPPPHQPHPLAIIDDSTTPPSTKTQISTRMSPSFRSGRYVPHIVTICLEDTNPVPIGTTQHPSLRYYNKKYQSPHLGQILEASPLDGSKASGVTCVKFSPSAEFCLLGYGVRESSNNSSNNGANEEEEEEEQLHPVTALYRIQGGLAHVSTMLSGDDDVNIARFHPESGYGFVYGTKQGRVRVLSCRPWNYYHP